MGESLNIEASIYFLEEFPEFADCYYEKSFAAAYWADYIAKVPFSFLQLPNRKYLMNLWGKRMPETLIHVDRVRLDTALYEKATASPYCTQLDARVAQMLCVPGSDKIDQLVLQDGSALPVSHLFDATGYVRLAARRLNIQRRMLGLTQHVVYAHYFRKLSASHQGSDAKWRHGTSNLRLYRERHGIDAMAWCIPLGNTLSVGVSTPDKAPRPSDEALITCVHEAYADYGITYLDEYQNRSRLATAKMEFYTHARAYGANWLLAGAAHTQIWWPTSSGLDTSVAAAHAAVPFLKQPEAVGRRYSRYLAPLAHSQMLWNWGTSHRLGALNQERGRQFAERLAWSISYRIFLSLTLEKQDFLSRESASVAARIWNNEFWAQYPSPISFSPLEGERK